MVQAERVVPSPNSRKEGTSELVMIPADALAAGAAEEAATISRIQAACEGCVSYKQPMYFNREEGRPLRCTYTRHQGKGLKNKWFRVDATVLGDWAAQQAEEIDRVLAALEHKRVLEQCACYEVPRSKEEFFQPIGEELQFVFAYKSQELQELCPPCAVSTGSFLSWADKIVRTSRDE